MSRSSGLPISVTLEGKERDETRESWASGKPLREAATKGLQRCKRLTLSASSTLLMGIVTLPHSIAPLLEYVDIRYDGHDRTRNPFSDKPNGICNGPAIRGIGFTGHLPANCILDLPLKRSVLTELRVSDSESGHNLLRLLTESPLIQRVHFVVQTHSYVSTSPPATDVITLPHLHSLAISPYNAERDFFDKLQLPALTKLSQSGIFGLWHLQQPIERYGSTIRHLSLCAYRFSARDLKGVLYRLPGLEKLELSDDVDYISGGGLRADRELPGSVLTGEATMQMLTPGYRELSNESAEFVDTWDSGDVGEDAAKKKSESVCPKLRGLTIRVTKGFPCGISDFAIYTFIQRRRSLDDVALRAVTITQEGLPPQRGFCVVKELRECGVDINGMTIHLQYAEHYD